MIDYVTLIPMKKGFKIFRTESTIQFIYSFYDENSGRWISGGSFVLPRDLAVLLLRPELLEESR